MRHPVRIHTPRKSFKLYWQLTDFCNHHCNYCPPMLNQGDHALGKVGKFPTDDEIDIFVDWLIEKQKETQVFVQIGGGEPTTHDHLPNIVQRLTAVGVRVGITTNGSRNRNYWTQLPNLHSVTISLHPEYCRIEKVLDTAQYIKDSGTTIFFALSLDPSNWDRVVELHTAFHQQFPNLVLPKILNYLATETRENYKYSKEQWEWIRNWTRPYPEHPGEDKYHSIMEFDDGTTAEWNLGRWTREGWHQFKGWSCSAGRSGFNVGFDGSIHVGVCRAQCIGSITDFVIPEQDIICPQQYCPCPLDLQFPKQINS